MRGLMKGRTALAGLAGLGAVTACAIPGMSGLDTSWVTLKQVGLKYASGSAAQVLDLSCRKVQRHRIRSSSRSTVVASRWGVPIPVKSRRCFRRRNADMPWRP
jgi:hypothetical protein